MEIEPKYKSKKGKMTKMLLENEMDVYGDGDLAQLGTSGLICDYRYQTFSNFDSGENEGLKWRIAELCREGFFILPYNELAIAQGPKIYQKKEL